MTPRTLPEGRPQDLGFAPDATKAIIGVLQAEVARQRLPGGVALVARAGQVLLHSAFGQGLCGVVRPARHIHRLDTWSA